MRAFHHIGDRPRAKALARPMTTAMLAAFFTLPCDAQFSSVINLPPDTVASSTIIGSDTQVNFYAGGSMGSNVNFGHWDGTSSNIEFNVFGGSLSSYSLNGDTTANIGGSSTSSTAWVGDNAILNLTAGVIRDLNVTEGSPTINISGGTVEDLNYFFLNEFPINPSHVTHYGLLVK